MKFVDPIEAVAQDAPQFPIDDGVDITDETLASRPLPVVPGSEPRGSMRTARDPHDKQPAPPRDPSNQTSPVRNISPGILRSYVFTQPEVLVTASLPPQARIIIKGAELLATEGKSSFTAKDLTDAAVRSGLVTRQLPERIIGYYLPTLRARGIIT